MGLSLENVSFTYSKDTPFEKKAVNDVSVSFPEGKITGLIGHTGCGKSTLVQLFNGLLKPDSGKVLLDGKDIWEDKKKLKDVRFRVGLVFQYPEYQLFEETVEKDISYGPKNMGLEDGEIKKRVLEAISFCGLDPSCLKSSPFDLSGGQKRRVAIAGIMAMKPEILVLDEPAAGLDPLGRESILGGIWSYQRASDSTVIIVSHSMEDMAKYTDYMVVMSKSKVVMESETEKIFSNSSLLKSIGLNVPQITEAIELLRSRGVALPENIFTVDRAKEEILRLIKEKGQLSQR